MEIEFVLSLQQPTLVLALLRLVVSSFIPSELNSVSSKWGCFKCYLQQVRYDLFITLLRTPVQKIWNMTSNLFLWTWKHWGFFLWLCFFLVYMKKVFLKWFCWLGLWFLSVHKTPKTKSKLEVQVSSQWRFLSRGGEGHNPFFGCLQHAKLLLLVSL